MFPSRLFDFLGWVAMQPDWKWRDLHEALHVPRDHSPLLELHLFGIGDRPRARELLRLDEPLETREPVVSARPIHDGFIAALEMVPARSGDARAAVDAFFEAEQERETEAWLRQCYGRDNDLAKTDVRFRGIDYPAFDNGSMSAGYGLMIDREQRRWLWSCAVFFHK